MSAFQPTGSNDSSVLVVDDDQATRDSLASVLKGAGIEVFVASDPTEALTLRGLQRPAAVVVDHQLAEHTGVDLAVRLKQEDPETPVLLLTGLASLDSALAASAQLDGLLVKPLVPQAFIQTVRNALTQRALSAENRQLQERLHELASQPAPPPVVVTEAAPPPPPPAEEPVGEPPNRPLFEDHLDRALSAAQRDSSSLAVLFVDIHGWAELAGQYGARAGEQAAREIASRLAVSRRKSDTVLRVAPDKFGVVCASVQSDADAARVAQMIVDAVARPVVAEGAEHVLQATVGYVVTDPSSADKADAVLENAELAMYGARDEGRSTRAFDTSMRDSVVSRYEVEQGLQSAMDNGEMALFYQPVVDLHSGHVVGAEALLRWQRPDHGVLLPGEFLGAAGDAGMAETLSRWTIDRALTELVLWREAENL
ncbi:MAG TPA: diguanylate cyclase, partial [Acidimicrobiales bacterium]|nr:diguanylate cyclase [Acidimicrobiales bacterium]